MRDELPLDNADIPINAPVPDHTKAISNTIIPDIFIKVNVIAHIDEMVLNDFFEIPARMLEEEGILVIEFNQSPQQMAPACGLAFDMIIHQQVVHAGDIDETRQVLAAVKVQQERGFTLSKGRSRIHIDAAITLCMGVDALARLAPDVDILETMW